MSALVQVTTALRFVTCKILPYEKLVTRGAAFNGKRADARDVAIRARYQVGVQLRVHVVDKARRAHVRATVGQLRLRGVAGRLLLGRDRRRRTHVRDGVAGFCPLTARV